MNSKIALFFFALIVATLAEEMKEVKDVEEIKKEEMKEIEKMKEMIPVPERYPPGVDPVLCPGYPNCNNELLHSTRLAYSYFPPGPFYARFKEFPAGVDPITCPNYPHCGTPAVLPYVGTLPIGHVGIDGKVVGPVAVPDLLRSIHYVTV